MQPLSIRDAYRGRHVLITGASGFLGKVWLALALEHLPDIGRIYVLLRPRNLLSGKARFARMFNTSPTFRGLRDRWGERLSAEVARRVEVVEGDVSEPGMGLAPDVAARLRRELDLIIHCAGLVDFNPDLRKALAANVDGAWRAAELAQQCRKAALIHVSTCYVAGSRRGRIPESLVVDRAPDGSPLDVQAELADLRRRIAAVLAEEASATAQEAQRAQVDAEIATRGLDANNATLQRNLLRRVQRERLKRRMEQEGTERAQQRGWCNTYTYTKALAEALLAERFSAAASLSPPPRWTVFRPSIVESSLRFPFPGWNQGFNASAPLAYVMGTWFRRVPARAEVPFDVIPVDFVCNALTVAGAAILRGQHAPVYQCGTSDRNRFTIGRVCDLIDLGHRRHLRKAGKTTLERVVLSRWDAVARPRERAFSLGQQRRWLDVARELFADLGERGPRVLQRRALVWAERMQDVEKRLAELETLVGMYEPFIHDNFHIFENRALFEHPPQEPEFACDPAALDWRSYWLDVHMPGLRRWAFPLFEGRQPESDRPVHLFQWPGNDDNRKDEAPTRRRMLKEVMS